MTQFNTLNVKVFKWQLNKLKLGIKNGAVFTYFENFIKCCW